MVVFFFFNQKAIEHIDFSWIYVYLVALKQGLFNIFPQLIYKIDGVLSVLHF